MDRSNQFVVIEKEEISNETQQSEPHDISELELLLVGGGIGDVVCH